MMFILLDKIQEYSQGEMARLAMFFTLVEGRAPQTQLASQMIDRHT